MILDLVPHNAEILRKKCAPFDFNAGDAIKLAVDLAETMLSHSGLGLAAPQVGIDARVIAIASNPVGVLFNPIIVDSSEAITELEESCLSFPGLSLSVKRPRLIRVRYSLPNGDVVTKQFSDMTARVICHEVDHLNGVTIIEAQEGLKRDMARKRWRKMIKHGVPVRKVPSVVDTAEMMYNVEKKMKQGENR